MDRHAFGTYHLKGHDQPPRTACRIAEENLLQGILQNAWL